MALKTENAHQAGLVIWKKALKGKTYANAPRGFRSEMVQKISKATGCSESSAQTYVQHYAKHGGTVWDYQARTAPRYAKAAKGKKARNGSKIKLPARAKARARKGGKGARAAA